MAGVCSLSTQLPTWASLLGACSAAAPPRPHLLSFIGGSLGGVRQALFAHFAAHPWPELLVVHGHVAPKRYMATLLASRFCLHARGTQVQSPRLVEMLLFGCVPVVMADSYDLPLATLLHWPAFSVRVPQDRPDLLPAALAAANYTALAAAACAVAPFFTYHAAPQPGDAFHMTMLQLAQRLAAERPGCAGGGRR